MWRESHRLGDKVEMKPNITKLVDRSKQLARGGDDKGAMLLADKLVQQAPSEAEVWMLRGYLHELKNDHQSAIADLTEAIAIRSADPRLFFARGRSYFASSAFERAVE